MLMAKIANDFGKTTHKGSTPPNAITIIEAGKEQEFLEPLPVSALWGVGPKTAERFHEMGIKTIGDIAKRTPEELVHYFGRTGLELLDRARGIDDRLIEVERTAKSISQETTFAVDVNDRETLTMTIKRLSAKVASQLRKQGFTAKTIRLKIRWENFETHTRQLSLTSPTNHDSIIVRSAVELFDKVWLEGKKVRLIGVGAAQLTNEPIQLNLLDRMDDREERLLRSVDKLRERFGQKIVYHGFDIKKNTNKETPH